MQKPAPHGLSSERKQVLQTSRYPSIHPVKPLHKPERKPQTIITQRGNNHSDSPRRMHDRLGRTHRITSTRQHPMMHAAQNFTPNQKRQQHKTAFPHIKNYSPKQIQATIQSVPQTNSSLPACTTKPCVAKIFFELSIERPVATRSKAC